MITQLTNKKYGYGSRVMILPLLIFLFCVITVKAQQLKNDYPKAESNPFISESPILLDNESYNNSIPFQTGDTVKISPEEFEKLYTSWQSKKQPLNFEGNLVKNNFYFISPPNKKVYWLTKAEFEVLAKKYYALRDHKEYNKTFTKVEIEAEFPGGENAWNHYIDKNLRNPVDASGKKMEGEVEVQFIVDKNGDVSDYQVKGGNSALQKEAIRLITQIKWLPAVQNGLQVKAYKKQTIVFSNKPKASNEKGNSSIANNSATDSNFSERQKGIIEIVAIARKEGKAAYHHKGRTYVFARIDANQPANVNTYYEADDSRKAQFILDGRLISSIDEINALYKRNDIKSLKLLFPTIAKEKYNTDKPVLEIETCDNDLKNMIDKLTVIEPD